MVRIRICITVKSRIRIKMIWIRNTGKTILSTFDRFSGHGAKVLCTDSFVSACAA